MQTTYIQYTTMPERMASMETQMSQCLSILKRMEAKVGYDDKRLCKVESTNRIILWLFSVVIAVIIIIAGSLGSEYYKHKLFKPTEAQAYEQANQ